MNSKAIARQFQKFIDGGRDDPAAPWSELFDLYRVARLLNAELSEAMAASSPADYNRLGNAIAGAKRARRDLHAALRPFEKLGKWGRDYIASQITVPEAQEARLKAIERLRESLSDHARSQYKWRGLEDGFDGLVFAILADCETRQRLQHQPSGIPARRFGLTDRLRKWFADQADRVVEDETAPDLPRPSIRDDDALGALFATHDTEAAGMFQAFAPSLLTATQQGVVRLKAQGFKDDEIAARLGLSLIAVRVHAHGARERLERFFPDLSTRVARKP